ncbi:MAG: hypothetical protein BMS9Abin29_2507 [Gemmatimonadota bacterium]|nr:MAG: hypothetical protein BMS9Abin29_2507 [Gemmatimonadota bacterium]
MGQSDARESPRKGRAHRPGRFRSVWQVLKGESLVPDEIRWEWIEYQQTFNSLLEKYSAQLARASKAEKVRIKALSEALEPSSPVSRPAPRSHKAELRARAAALRGIGVPERTYEGPMSDHVPPPLAPEKEP